MLRRHLVYLTILFVLSAAGHAHAGGAKEVEEFADRYVAALESGRFDEAVRFAAGAAASWVEYLEAVATRREGSVSVISRESAQFSGYWLTKVVFQVSGGGFGVRYVKIAESADGALTVIDDGRRGRGWASDSFLQGVLFREADEIDGVGIQVLALLELPDEIKFDILIHNSLDREVAIYPQLEAYYTVETSRVGKKYYYPLPVENRTDGPIPAGSSKRGFVVFPKFVKDFAEDPKLEGLRWVLYIPYGVDRQFAILR